MAIIPLKFKIQGLKGFKRFLRGKMSIDSAVSTAAIAADQESGIDLSVRDLSGKATGGVVDSGIRFMTRKIYPVLALIDFGLLSVHLGLDRYGSHDIEAGMFLWDPVDYNPAKKQRVHEIYAPNIAENRYANAALYAIAAPFSVLGFISYPIEKTAEHFFVAAEKINKMYENNRLCKALK